MPAGTCNIDSKGFQHLGSRGIFIRHEGQQIWMDSMALLELSESPIERHTGFAIVASHLERKHQRFIMVAPPIFLKRSQCGSRQRTGSILARSFAKKIVTSHEL